MLEKIDGCLLLLITLPEPLGFYIVPFLTSLPLIEAQQFLERSRILRRHASGSFFFLSSQVRKSESATQTKRFHAIRGKYRT